MTAPARLHDERGLMGKIVIVWLLLLAVFVVAALDTGSIMLTSFRLNNAADNAAFEAATSYHNSKSRTQAYKAAVQIIEQDAAGAKIPESTFSIDPRTGSVTLTVVKRASTIVAWRLSFTRPWTLVTATSTARPPTF